MNRKSLSILAALCMTTMCATSLTIADINANAETSVAQESYSWGRVNTGAGGGFIPGIIFSPVEKDLAYTRTDMGGIYRWDPANEKWKPLTDWVGMDDWNYLGCESLAADPKDADKVYAAVGTYTNDWAGNGAILRSSDRGDTWDVVELPFKIGGNMPGRSMGERLAVDPNDTNILYLGTHNGNGLWKSTDAGATWNKVDSFTAVGNYIDPNFKDQIGVTWVTFDPSSSEDGSPCQTIYVGVADTENSIYVTKDGGKTWSALEGQPTVSNQEGWYIKNNNVKESKALLPHHGVLASDGSLIITYSSECGPYDGSKGDLWKYNTKTGEWTNISPIATTNDGDNFAGFQGVAVDPQNPNHIVVTFSAWWPDANIYSTNDGGKTWNSLWQWECYPNRNMNYTQDISKAPWLSWGSYPSPPEVTPKIGWMMGSIAIDPFDSDHVLYGTGATMYGSNDFTNLDNDGKVTISVAANGIEEEYVSSIISPSKGPQLISGMADVAGFVHDDITKVPDKLHTNSTDNATCLDFAEENPTFIVRVTDSDVSNGTKACSFSRDSGKNWYNVNNISNIGNKSGGTIALSPDGNNIVWAPETGSVSYIGGNGGSWTACSGVPSGAKVVSDRVNSDKFYAYSNGTVYVSTDGGKSFTAGATGLPTDGTCKLKAVTGKEGEIWFAGGEEASGLSGLWKSTDSGQTFTKIDLFDIAYTVGYGKAADGADYPAIYANGKIDGQYGIYRSTDAGESWIRINDDQHQYGAAKMDITGDPRIFGRVYMCTNGLGIVYGDTNGYTLTPEGPETPKDVLLGDVNDDKKVTIKDYIKLQKYIMNNSIEINNDNADMNNDGKINITDALLLKKKLMD